MLVKSIRDVLDGRPVVPIAPGARLDRAFDYFELDRTDVLVVLEHGALKGLLAETDLIRHVSQMGGLHSATVAEVMRSDLPAVHTRQSICEALAAFGAGRFDHLPVLDMAGDVVGVLSPWQIPSEYRMMASRGAQMSIAA